MPPPRHASAAMHGAPDLVSERHVVELLRMQLQPADRAPRDADRVRLGPAGARGRAAFAAAHPLHQTRMPTIADPRKRERLESPPREHGERRLRRTDSRHRGGARPRGGLEPGRRRARVGRVARAHGPRAGEPARRGRRRAVDRDGPGRHHDRRLRPLRRREQPRRGRGLAGPGPGSPRCATSRRPGRTPPAPWSRSIARATRRSCSGRPGPGFVTRFRPAGGDWGPLTPLPGVRRAHARPRSPSATTARRSSSGRASSAASSASRPRSARRETGPSARR